MQAHAPRDRDLDLKSYPKSAIKKEEDARTYAHRDCDLDLKSHDAYDGDSHIYRLMRLSFFWLGFLTGVTADHVPSSELVLAWSFLQVHRVCRVYRVCSL